MPFSHSLWNYIVVRVYFLCSSARHAHGIHMLNAAAQWSYKPGSSTITFCFLLLQKAVEWRIEGAPLMCPWLGGDSGQAAILRGGSR